jgi:hypothetical protein
MAMLNFHHFRERASAFIMLVAMLSACTAAVRLWAQAGPEDSVASARAKLAAIRNGALNDPAASLTFSGTEVNAWIAAELAAHSASGVESIKAELLEGRVSGTAQLDFDALRRSSHRPLPPLTEYLLTGKHELRVEGTLSGSGGTGRFGLESVEVDGLPIPPLLRDLLLRVLLRGRYPALDIDSLFDLPYSIDTLRVQPGRITVAGASSAAA